MPLHLIGQCCKCKSFLYFDLWSIAKNHKYSNESRYVCEHFDVEIDHESKIGFFGIGWSNKIKVTAEYKPNYESKVIINETFNKNHTESENYEKFSNKVVFHARISDYKNRKPTKGFSVQDDIEYEEKREQEELRIKEEMQRKKKLNNLIQKNKMDEKQKDILIKQKTLGKHLKKIMRLKW